MNDYTTKNVADYLSKTNVEHEAYDWGIEAYVYGGCTGLAVYRIAFTPAERGMSWTKTCLTLGKEQKGTAFSDAELDGVITPRVAA